MTKLFVSIHDVTGIHEQRVRRLWDLCRVFEILPALLVVPNWHGTWPLKGHRTLVSWLRGVEADGAEILLHGERHDEVGLSRRWNAWRAIGRTAREGEFFTLTYDQAHERIARGLDVLRDAGLTPIGFVPPAWLARADSYRAAGDAGLHVSEDTQYVFALRSRQAVRSPVLRWSARSRWRATASAFVAEARACAPPTANVARLALHPSDLADPWTSRSVRRTLRRWTSRMRPTTYAEIVRQADGVTAQT